MLAGSSLGTESPPQGNEGGEFANTFILGLYKGYQEIMEKMETSPLPMLNLCLLGNCNLPLAKRKALHLHERGAKDLSQEAHAQKPSVSLNCSTQCQLTTVQLCRDTCGTRQTLLWVLFISSSTLSMKPCPAIGLQHEILAGLQLLGATKAKTTQQLLKLSRNYCLAHVPKGEGCLPCAKSDELLLLPDSGTGEWCFLVVKSNKLSTIEQRENWILASSCKPFNLLLHCSPSNASMSSQQGRYF